MTLQIVAYAFAAALRGQVDDVFSTTILDSFVEDDWDISVGDGATSFGQLIVGRWATAGIWMMGDMIEDSAGFSFA